MEFFFYKKKIYVEKNTGLFKKYELEISLITFLFGVWYIKINVDKVSSLT